LDIVRLLPRHLKDFQIISDNGTYGADGEFIPAEAAAIDFKAAPFPVTGNDLRLFPEGDLSLNDLKLYTKYDLDGIIDKKIVRVSSGEEFQLKTLKPYKEIADLRVYILKKWAGES